MRFACVLAATVIAGSAIAAPQFPFPHHAAYARGTLKPNHRTQVQLDQDVRDFYAWWKSQYLVQDGTEPDGQPRYRIRANTDGNGNTVSEAQGYGITIVSLMAGEDPAAQTIVDGLWEYFNDHRSGIDPRLMTWNVTAGGQAQYGNNSAYDGDADLALGLLIASAQWGNNGRIDYRAKALDIAAGQAASVTGPVSRLPMLGDWVAPDGSQYNQWTVRPSDFMPAHFLNFQSFASNGVVWAQVIAATGAAIEHLQTYAPTSHLVPDFAIRESAGSSTLKPANPGFLEGPHDGDYNYNAGRVPWRLATHALLHGDGRAAVQAYRMSSWIQTATGGNASLIRPGYTLAGTPITTSYFTSFFAAPFGTAAMVGTGQQAWLNAVYDSVRSRHEGYYEDSVNLLCLLLMSGSYWDPVSVDRIFQDGLHRVAQ
ncbi:glycosyl hydrolase family 8 [Tahibacter amnicola]|uniref:cellulase n=1 Tax=Tahibacter amnicola TaxID=2976241 RepID=A0ABY6BMB2_9GAMM|nr:glycosyl hydrolase family 8 [Tahibacter amnicola]UXI70603.1 glycosyl hydrolase family 8 [Tahibacter amnicola]